MMIDDSILQYAINIYLQFLVSSDVITTTLVTDMVPGWQPNYNYYITGNPL